MPATFPSHAAVVLPLKLWRPRWFDGVALVVGSMAPDLAYPFHRIGLVRGHSWLGLLWWCLPVTLLCCFAIRRTAPVIAAQLPWAWARDWGALRLSGHRWWVTTSSALVAAASHLAWDSFTHPRSLRFMPSWWASDALAGLPWWHLAQYTSTAVGGLIATRLLVRIARLRLIRRWHGDPPTARRAPLLFWPVALAAPAVGVVTWPWQADRWAVHIQVSQFLLLAGAGLVLAAWVVERREGELSGGGDPVGAVAALARQDSGDGVPDRTQHDG